MIATADVRHGLETLLQVHITRTDAQATLACSGRLALECDPERLVRAARHELSRGRHVVIDLDGVTGVDASGLGTIARLCESARAAGRSVTIARARPRVRRLLEVAFGAAASG